LVVEWCGVSGLCPVTMFASATEGLLPDILLLKNELISQGVECTLTTNRNLAHCWPITPIPEAKSALAVIWDVICR